MAGMALVRMGRFAEAERHLDRAEESLRAAADPGTEVVLHHARGMLRFGQGRFDEALAEFARAQALERLLASEHVFTSTSEAGDPGSGPDGRHGGRAASRSPGWSRTSATAPACASRARPWSSNRTIPNRRSTRSRR